MGRNIDNYLQVSTYNFKCHIAKYIRLLQAGQREGIIIKQYNKPVALVVPLISPSDDDEK